MRVLGLRNPALPLDACNNFSFGLLENGCPLLSVERLAEDRPQVAEVLLSSDADTNGYFLKIPYGQADADPVRWIVEVSSAVFNQSAVPVEDSYSGDIMWRAVGASTWHGPYPVGELYPQLNYPTPTLRGEEIIVDCRPSWTWLLAEVATNAVSVIGYFAYSVFGSLHRERLAIISLFILYSFSAALHIIAGAGSWAAGDWRSAVQYLTEALPDVLLTLSVLCCQRKIIIASVFYGFIKSLIVVSFALNICCLQVLIQLPMQIIRCEVIYPYPSDLPSLIFSTSGFTKSGVQALVFGIVITVFHKRALCKARKMVLADKALYNQVWSDILKHDEQRRQIEELSSLVNDILSRLDVRSTVRQLNRFRSSGPGLLASAVQSGRSFESFQKEDKLFFSSSRGSHTTPAPEERGPIPNWSVLLDCGTPNLLDVQHPVDSLDQLYFQAVALNPILIRKVQSWALISGGCFYLIGKDLSAVTPWTLWKSSKSWKETFKSRGSLQVGAGQSNMSTRTVTRTLLHKAVQMTHVGRDSLNTQNTKRSSEVVVVGNPAPSTLFNFETSKSTEVIENNEKAVGEGSSSTLHADNSQGIQTQTDHSQQGATVSNTASSVNSAIDHSIQLPQLPAGYVRWEVVREQEIQHGGLVKWGKIKSVQRALEKSTRSYGKVARVIEPAKCCQVVMYVVFSVQYL